MISSSNQSGCCPGAEHNPPVVVTRTVIADLASVKQFKLSRTKYALDGAVVTFKALSKKNGTSKLFRNMGSISEKIETKANLGSTLIGTEISRIIPGDSDPLKSPIRSTAFRTLTPNKPSLGGVPSKPNRGYRCPEGYQFGGRFTNSKLSTCGAQLFDIPSPLGLAIGEIRKLGRRLIAGQRAQGNPIIGGNYPQGIIESRKPSIPKVTFENRLSRDANVKKLVQEIGNFNGKATRMVRRDGFSLEPVVPAKVLRAIPDNRDMEGATYILSALSPSDIGNDELGLLSNTGVRSLVYVMPGGSTLTLEKKRTLAIGERRKLGRTVNTAMTLDNSKDPAARLKNISTEIGDGIGYSESFVGLKNPNEIVNGKQRWALDAFKRKLGVKPLDQQSSNSRDTISYGEKGKLITSIEEAITHLENGGDLSKISPTILAEVLQNSQSIRRQELANNQSLIIYGNSKYFLYTSPSDFQHIGERFASDVQQHLGLASPDVILAGAPGDSRSYLRQDVETAFQGAKFNPNVKFQDFKPEDVAKMMVSDFLTDQRDRPGSSIYPMVTSDGPVPMLAQNITSGLVELDKIDINKRINLRIDAYFKSAGIPDYSKYYTTLKGEQQITFRKSMDKLIKNARSFKLANLRKMLESGGLSDGEKNHLNIVEKLYSNRLETLSNSKRTIVEILKGIN